MPRLLVQVLRGEFPSRPPIWLMRQAGRYLPEYQALRQQTKSFLELCYTPALALEVTLQPVRRFALDAAILFSDILVVPHRLGREVTFVENEGPRLEPLTDAEQIVRLSVGRMREQLAPVYDVVRQVRRELPDDVALIGFAGAPWTLAAYMVEGSGSKEFLAARRLAWQDRDAFARLVGVLTEATIAHLGAQIDAGADVVQIFDSWAGVLPEPEFERWCQQPAAEIVAALKRDHPGVPVIVFPRGAGALYAGMAQAVRPDGLGLDTTVPLHWARRELSGICLQGNLDPVALLVGGDVRVRETARILDTLAGARFIFNLGHGVLPETDPDEVAALVEQVRSYRLPVAK